jgi:[ribosomal protein S5]-alanine N-acetyltransferase
MKSDPLRDAQFLDFTCPYCGNMLAFPKVEAGTLKQCPNCLEAMFVPARGARTAERIPFPIQTSRLRLRRLDTRDGQELHDLMAKDDHFGSLPWTTVSGEETEEWLADEKQVQFPFLDTRLNLAIETLAGARMVGLVLFWLPGSEFDLAEFSILIHPAWRRKRYATEAVQGLFGYAFQGLRVHRIVAECDQPDEAARGMLRNAGLRQEGWFLKARKVKHDWVDTLGFALLREEYERHQLLARP